MSAPARLGLLTFAAMFAFHAYRTLYVYTLIPRTFLVGDFLVSAITGLLVAGVVALMLRDLS